jgi:gamma-glutamyltranspeptidase/glutathione hydrolase
MSAIRSSRIHLPIVAALLASCTPTVHSGPDIPPRANAAIPAGWRFAGRPATFAEHALVASNSPLASAAGAEILRAGGNAVDAAVAVGFAMAVTYPEAGNIGGGGYMVIRLADGRSDAIDYREMAPAAGFREMYIDSAGKLTKAGIVGRAASGVPGAVAGLTSALAKYGSMPLEKVMAPAIRLASEGFVIDSALASSWAKDSIIRKFAGADLLVPGGKPLARGDRLVQPDLAETLRAIAREGAAGFYRGPVAEKIVAELSRDCPAGVSGRARASHSCGLMTTQDLANYKPAWREPLKTTYRGYSLITMPPSSSGGITVGESLNILESFDKLPAFGTPEYFNVVGSAFQRAFVDRNEKLGDPDFVKVPVAQLLDKSYARRLASTIAMDRHTPTNALASAKEGMETTHYSVVDAKGNAVATTTTLNSLFGSGVYIRGAGFFMNNEMDDFTSEPGKPNQFGLVQGESNSIQPGKRMLSAMSPSIVLDPKGNVLLVVGGRGGPRIITSTTQVILNVIDNRMSLSDAMGAPRIHHQALPDTLRYEKGGLDTATIQKLQAMGYALQGLDKIGSTTVAIMRVKGGWNGMVDPRASGAAVGY